MTVSTIGVADADTPDKYLWTEQRTVSSVAREAQYVLEGESAYPTYCANATNVSIATTADHVLQLMGDGTNYSRLKRVTIYPYFATADGTLRISLLRISSAGTGGTSVTPRPYDTADTYAGGAMTLPSSKGTEGVTLQVWNAMIRGGTVKLDQPIIWEPPRGAKPIIFGTATTNGLAFKIIAGITGGTVDINAEFITTSYL